MQRVGTEGRIGVLQPCCYPMAWWPRELATGAGHSWSPLGVTLLIVVVLEDDVFRRARLGGHGNSRVHMDVGDVIFHVYVALMLGDGHLKGRRDPV